MLPALRTFEAVARHSSVTRAAHELNVTPGAVSQQVKQLERALRTELFVRRHRGLSLTDAGNLLANRLTLSFEEIERAVLDIVGDPSARRLRLKTTPSFAIRWLVPRLGLFYERHPEFEIEVATYPRQEDALVEELDFVVRHGRGDWDDVQADHLFDDALVPVCSPQLATKLDSVASLAQQNLLHSMMRHDAWERWFAQTEMPGLRPTRNTRLANAAVTYQAAINGLGVALAQIAYVEDDLASGRLVMPFESVMRTGEGYWLAFARRKAKHPSIELFRAWIREVTSEVDTQVAAAIRSANERQQGTAQAGGTAI
jgi:DNA-binding transcriptional LysR family regulator